MGKYIILTTEGLTYQPNSDSTEPDIENMQVIGFAQGNSIENALSKFLELNPYIASTNFDEIFTIQLKNDHQEYFSLRNLTKKVGQADSLIC